MDKNLLDIINDIKKDDSSDEGLKQALFACQEEKGEISIADQEKIAEIFGVSRGAISLIMRFNKGLKQSQVLYDIYVCTAANCSKNGAAGVIGAVEKKLGIKLNETSSDGKIRLFAQRCFKLCDRGPNIRINDEYYNRQTAESAAKLMEDVLKKAEAQK